MFCHELLESEAHLFLRCGFSEKLRYLVFKWLGLMVVLLHDLPTMFFVVYLGVGFKKGKGGLLVIWHVVLWVI